MNRWQASLIHLIISFLILSTIAIYVIYFWYPIPLLPMANADKLLMLVAGIDLILGPLLTLIVFKQGKPSLKMDLTVIAIVQASFLGFGLHTLYESRPVYLVASGKMFHMVFANEILAEDLAKAVPEYQNLSFTHPRLVGAVLPSDKQERSQLMMSALFAGHDVQQSPQYYVSYDKVVPDILKNSMMINSAPLSAPKLAALKQAVQDYGYVPEQVRIMNLGSARGFATILLDAKTAKVIGYANVDL
ncbi:TfpX/TfpZ family type IV pilin accessory protein [Agitococcus lubricus]|uniref:Type IV pilin accessory protein n=1 Tax=Agitococcus lubricus TaxID=1077255 RepID=A0A2T5J0T1_9GAMM|nr:TfpX/TfpZ family type IV pilin accessory protein [Agitococcus lubricus]PTQ89991.1 hypothetical protein C8N29_10429 [Agitococcus lubricus]